MRIKPYPIISRAVEESVRYGVARAHKYNDCPGRDEIADAVEQAVMSELCETIDFEDDYEEEGDDMQLADKTTRRRELAKDVACWVLLVGALALAAAALLTGCSGQPMCPLPSLPVMPVLDVVRLCDDAARRCDACGAELEDAGTLELVTAPCVTECAAAVQECVAAANAIAEEVSP